MPRARPGSAASASSGMRRTVLLGLWSLTAGVPLVSRIPGGQELEEERAPGEYSFEAGVAFLEATSKAWRDERGCVTCHTNGWGLAAQPVVAPGSEEVANGRAFAQGYLMSFLEGEATPRGQYGSVEGKVATAAFLALSDARSGDEVHGTTRAGLDHAWELLDESGTWESWLQCNWPPFESDAEYGPTLMLVALGELEDAAGITAKDRHAAGRLVGYLKANEPASLHARAMRLWASSHWPGAASSGERRAWRRQLLAAQAGDGGWSMASLAGPAWRRDGGEHQTATSEAYPTAFVVHVLLMTGTERSDEAVRAGLAWLRANQREGGDWYTRSPRRDGKHYISRAATAFALMALVEEK